MQAKHSYTYKDEISKSLKIKSRIKYPLLNPSAALLSSSLSVAPSRKWGVPRPIQDGLNFLSVKCLTLLATTATHTHAPPASWSAAIQLPLGYSLETGRPCLGVTCVSLTIFSILFYCPVFYWSLTRPTSLSVAPRIIMHACIHIYTHTHISAYAHTHIHPYTHVHP